MSSVSQKERRKKPNFKSTCRDFPGVQLLRLCASNAGGVGSIPGWGTRIPHAAWHGQKKKKVLANIMVEKFPNLAKYINLQIQEAESMPRYIIIKLLETIDKEKTLKAAREKRHFFFIYEKNNSNDRQFLIRIHRAKRKWNVSLQLSQSKMFIFHKSINTT